ncbi:MAG: PIN domain-containing protein [Coriobacteriia bacterium]|nr:PIN domain-containing protein [Coriobacteriia bacterium]
MTESRCTRVVVDSSVAFKWFAAEREAGVARAGALLQAHLDEVAAIHAPDHLRLEVLNALRCRGFDGPALDRASAELDGFRLTWHRIDAALATSAATIASRHALTLYDAAFAALALELDAELLTADRRLAGSGACRVSLLGE